MGKGRCNGDHDFAVRKLGAGLARMECRLCATVVVDLDAVDEESRPVTSPGLFRPKKPTIFSVLAEEQRAQERSPSEGELAESASTGPRYAFGEPAHLRR